MPLNKVNPHIHWAKADSWRRIDVSHNLTEITRLYQSPLTSVDRSRGAVLA